MVRSLRLLAALALSLLPLRAGAQTDATYTVRLDATWSAATHPDDFPPSPHFSPLVAVTHEGAVALWRLGETASMGIERMAESGITSTLTSEAAALGAAVHEVVVGPDISISPGPATLTITASESHSTLSLVTMLAPSPDWFVGVSGLALRDAGGWLPSISVDLFTLDAGTDSGLTYTAPNLDTQPRQPIAQIDGYPFAPGGTTTRVGTLTLTRTGVANEPATSASALSLTGPAPARSGSTWTVAGPASDALRVTLYDLTGRRVATLFDGPLAASAAVRLPAVSTGVYVLHAASGRDATSRVLTVVR